MFFGIARDSDTEIGFGSIPGRTQHFLSFLGTSSGTVCTTATGNRESFWAEACAAAEESLCLELSKYLCSRNGTLFWKQVGLGRGTGGVWE